MLEPDENGVMMRLGATPGRRWFAVGAIYALGALVIWLAVTEPPAPGWAIVLVAMGAAALLLAEMLRRATALTLELTVEGLRDSSGRMLARWDDIARIDRGTFAFKPSNGFLIVLKDKGPRAWVPGLWWRVGRRVGVGGVTSGRETRFMAEAMALRLEGAG